MAPWSGSLSVSPPIPTSGTQRRGLATFKRNLQALQPVLARALLTREVALLSFGPREEEPGKPFVEAAWRMGADLNLPWQPRVELTGRTRFFVRPQGGGRQGGRIEAYDESWDAPAGEVLLQLLRPWRHRKSAQAAQQRARGMIDLE